MMSLVASFFIATSIGACANNAKSWEEDVQLNDGRVIKVTQWHRYERVYNGERTSDLMRDTQLTFALPEFSATPIVWHEQLFALILNVNGGKLYVVGLPWTTRETIQYGYPKPGYIGYTFINGRWTRLKFEDIPKEIYESNLWLSTDPPKDKSFVSLERKTLDRKQIGLPDDLRRIDPNSRFGTF
jgi:hypothetical protein